MVIPFGTHAKLKLERLAQQAQSGDKSTREYLLSAYRPFILQAASRTCGRRLTESDEELSIALLAFNEAIDSFCPKQGAGFLSLAGLVIRRRLADNFRRESTRREVLFSGLWGEDDKDHVFSKIESRVAEQQFTEQELTRDRQEEIFHFRQLLARYGITLDELVRLSPKHADARMRAMAAAQSIADYRPWCDHFRQYGELPLKAMEGKLPISRKTLERQRKYIVSLLIVHIEDLPHIREYLKGV